MMSIIIEPHFLAADALRPVCIDPVKPAHFHTSLSTQLLYHYHLLLVGAVSLLKFA